MLNNTLFLKVKQRLNKLDSNDYNNLQCWQFVEAYNKGALMWCRRQLNGSNQKQQGDEQTKHRIDDLQVLLKSITLNFTKQKGYWESELLPADYMEFKRLSAVGKSSCCKDSKNFMIYLVEENNIGEILRDELRAPNFEWAETVCTIIGNRIRIYTNDEFDIDSAKLMYYKLPVKIQIENCVNPYTGSLSTTEVISEFKDDITELLVDEAAAIIAGDIESLNQFYINTQNVEKNN